MSETKIAARYAKALYELAMESKSMEPIVADMHKLQELVSENPDIAVFLNSPLYSKAIKSAKLEEIFASFQKSTRDLFRLMTTKNRENLLPLVAREYISLHDTQNGITEAEVSSAVELNDKSLEDIRLFVKNHTGAKTVNIRMKIDPSLIGGLKILFAGKLYDSSISSQLNNIKKELKIA